MDDNQNNNLTDDQLLDKVTAQVLEKVMLRAAKDLTEEDLKVIEELDKDDKDGKKVRKYLLEKVPNFETILFEELQAVKKQASG